MRSARSSAHRKPRQRLAHSSYENECPRCGFDIEDWRDAAKTRGGRWVHKRCMSGADDA